MYIYIYIIDYIYTYISVPSRLLVSGQPHPLHNCRQGAKAKGACGSRTTLASELPHLVLVGFTNR